MSTLPKKRGPPKKCETVQVVAKRGRGRPPKSVVTSGAETPPTADVVLDEEAEPSPSSNADKPETPSDGGGGGGGGSSSNKTSNKDAPPIKAKLTPLSKPVSWFRQKFREEWCRIPAFEGWLEAVPDDPFHCWCRVCQCELTVGRSELVKHTHTKKHQYAIAEEKNPSILTAASLAHMLEQETGVADTESLAKSLENGETSNLEQLVDAGKMVKILETTPTGEVKTSFSLLSGRAVHSRSWKQQFKPIDDALMSAELRLAAFIVEHNLSGTAIDHLGHLIEAIGQRPDIASKIKLTKSKCTAMAKNVLARSIHESLDEALQRNRFSLIIDDSIIHRSAATSMSTSTLSTSPTIRVVTLLVRYYDDSKNRIQQGLLESFVLQYDEDIVDTIAAIFRQRNIPLANILGVAADRVSVIYKDLEVLKKGLFCDNEGVVVFSCNHRSIAEVCTLAVNQAMPGSLQKIVQYLGPAALAMQQRTDTMQFDHGDRSDVNDRIPNYIMDCGWIESDRWLVEVACIRLLLRHIDVLAEQLEKDVSEFRMPVDEALLKDLADPYTKAHLMFLNYILTPFKTIQDLFWSDEVVLHRLQSECRVQFRVICQHFLTPSAYMLGDLATVDPYLEKNLLPIKDVFVGFDCQVQLQNLDPEMNELFLGQCRKFLQVATSELQNRIPLSGELLDCLAFLDPDVALKEEGRALLPTLDVELASRIGGFDVAKLCEQWHALLNFFSDEDLQELRKLPLESMWGVIGGVSRNPGEDVSSYDEVAQIAAAIADDMDGNGNGNGTGDKDLAFGQIARLAKMALSLPITNREVNNLSEISVELQRKCSSSSSSSVTSFRQRQGLRTSKETVIRTLDTIVPIKHSLKFDSTECHTMRLTDKHRKFYRLDIAKKTTFEDDPNLFVDDSTEI